MIVLLFLLIVASLAPALYIGLRRRRFYTAFIALLGYYCCQIPFLLLGQFPYPEPQVYEAAIYATIANLVLSAALIACERKLQAVPEHFVYLENPRYLTTVAFGFLLVFFLYSKYSQGEIGLENVWVQREFGESSLVAPLLTYAGFLLFVLWVPLSRPLQLAALPLLIFVFLTTGARVTFMVIAGYLLYIALSRLRMRGLLIAAPIGTLALMALHVVARVARSAGAGALLSGDFRSLGVSFSGEVDLTGGESSIAEAFVIAIQLKDTGIWDSPPFTTLLRILLLPVPTSVVTFKPPDITYTLWRDAVQLGYFDFDNYFQSIVESYSLGLNGSLHPIIWGDAFLNAGWFACVIWPVLVALVLFLIERPLIKYRGTRFAMMLAGISAPALVYLMRGNVFLGVAFFILVPIAWYVTYPRPAGAPKTVRRRFRIGRKRIV